MSSGEDEKRKNFKKWWYIYTVEYYWTIKKKNITICDNVDGPRGYRAK